MVEQCDCCGCEITEYQYGLAFCEDCWEEQSDN